MAKSTTTTGAAAAAASLGWKIDWEHRYGVSREVGPMLPVFDTTSRLSNSSSPAPFSAQNPSPPPAQEEQDSAVENQVSGSTQRESGSGTSLSQEETPPSNSNSSNGGGGGGRTSEEVLPQQLSDDPDLSALLLSRPTLTRSETKSTMAARVEASRRSDVIQDAGGAVLVMTDHHQGGTTLQAAAPYGGGALQSSSKNMKVVMVEQEEDEQKKEDLFAAQAKEDGAKGRTSVVNRHMIEDSLESLDSRECLHVSWSQRYGINSRSPSPAILDGPAPLHHHHVATPPPPQQAPPQQPSPPVGSPSDLTVCSHCEEQPANVICPPCGSLLYCTECDTVLHRAVKLRQHVRRRTSTTTNITIHGGMAITTTATATDGGERGGNDVVQEEGDSRGVQLEKNGTTPYFEIDRHEIRILAKLGEGYFGIVYKGLWAGQNVAVKKLKHGTRRHVDEFINECLILGKLRHPNITTFYGVTSSPDWLIVTELLHGSLYKLLHGQTRPIPPAVLRRIAKDIACGAAYIHGLNPSIVHRDINSSNVLLTGDITALERIVEENRNEPLAKLSDFGLSRSVERFMTQCTGNAYYLAPEVFRGQHYTEKADCYSYGILLWELFTRKYPFSNLNPRSAAFQQAELHLRPPITPGVIDPEVVSIMTRAWDADPEKRMPFRDIVLEWGRMEEGEGEGGLSKSRGRHGAEEGRGANGGDKEGGGREEGEGKGGGGGKEERWADRTSWNGGEYIAQPMEWRKRLLDDKLLRRPTVLHVMQKELIRPPPSSQQQGEGGDGGDEHHLPSSPGGEAGPGSGTLFGYDWSRFQ